MSFLDQEAPAGYIPGLGRGATGFTTRTDLGSARAPSQPVDDDEDRYQNAEDDSGLLRSNNMSVDDKEADEIYSQVEERMESRRKKPKQKPSTLAPGVDEEFGALKRQLGTVSSEEWADLPEVGDLTRRNKRLRKEQMANQRYYAAPDALLSSRVDLRNEVNYIDDEDIDEADFKSIAAAKDKLLDMKLKEKEDPSAKLFDINSYMEGLSKGSDTQVSDKKKAKTLLQSLVKAQPNDPHAWIGLARVEEQSKKMESARAIIAQGCQNCPKNTQIWLENIRLSDKRNAKVIANRALQQLPTSVNLWIAATDLEDSNNAKRKVIRKGLEYNPESDDLWKILIDLEDDPSNAKLILEQAVQLVPRNEELWLTLIKFEKSPKKASKIIADAHAHLPGSVKLLQTACFLTEDLWEDPDRVVEKVKDMENDRYSFEDVLFAAKDAEKNSKLLSCSALAKYAFKLLPNDAHIATVVEKLEADHFLATADFFLECQSQQADSEEIWINRIKLCLDRTDDGKKQLPILFESAVSAFPSSVTLWLLYSRASREEETGFLPDEKLILDRAAKHVPNSEEIWLEAAEERISKSEFAEASTILSRALETKASARLYVKAVTLKRISGEDASGLVNAGLAKYSDSEKLWIQYGQIQPNQKLRAEVYSKAVVSCPQSEILWVLFSRAEKENAIIKARTVLDRAILRLPKSELIWLERIALEKEQNSSSAQIDGLINQALRECPKSGRIWALYIAQQPPLQRKTKLIDAVKRCNNDANLLVIVARDFVENGKNDKARSWFERALSIDDDNGDIWMWYYRCMIKDKDEQGKAADDFKSRFLAANPKHGMLWPAFRKDLSRITMPKWNVFLDAVATI